MNRFFSVLKITVLGFLFVNVIIIGLIFLDSLFDGSKMPWDYLLFVNIYGVILSVILGYMDRPKLEKQLLIGITICSSIALITSLFIDNQVIQDQSLYVFFGIVFGRKMVVLVDVNLKKSVSKKADQ